ncbi:HAD-IIB family hydrolase [Waterburya agarophytonicola K14]|uniref:HAD-IIB family hydrolase n=1 Tax=Waterburya agarophytonicola KI4 TaxID=2874699 RepID=A0A964BN25_9CYAN|nr:HAD-IIB family hydrolase [Waterburya agarophytonicola]MCC0176034.1 HAD-IIB family hydrolase [Waterburya agarophytonicola KI4]
MKPEIITKGRLKPINNYDWTNIKLIASDMDGTLTKVEQFDSELFDTLDRLATAGVKVLITTGRSAGWVQAIATYLPIVGAIAENGGLLYWQDDLKPRFMSDLDFQEHRLQLNRVYRILKSKFPQLEESPDNVFRLTDWTFEVAGLSLTELEHIEAICNGEGYGFTYSTIQCHIKPIHQDKGLALDQVISQHFPDLKPEQILTIGDSPNDESLFNPEKFSLSIGVANIVRYRDHLQYLPAYMTSKFEGEGFRELAELIINS